MANESGGWIMYGVGDDHPDCVHDFGEMLELVQRAGFLPLFRNEIPGFSVEEYANPYYWWTGNEERDPWEWRKQAARSRAVAYGKFFGGKAGFVSLDWLPVLAAYRRNGYDFEELWYAGQAQFRMKKVMDCLTEAPELPGWELKKRAGFGSGGEKNFSGTLTALQNMFYVVISDFRRRKNKYGFDYGWDVSVYSRPEELWGSALIGEACAMTPSSAYYELRGHMDELYPTVTDTRFTALIGTPPKD